VGGPAIRLADLVGTFMVGLQLPGLGGKLLPLQNWKC
jgi:hypothetical protein